MTHFAVPVNFSAGTTFFSFLLIFHWSSSITAETIELGQVKCVVIINFSQAFYDAERNCWDQMKKEIQTAEKNEAKDKEKRYPYNATIEEFEWDDKCVDHCTYKAVGILGEDDTLPEKMEVEKLFTKGKVAEGHYKAMTSAWSDCLQLSGKIGKEKGFDKCKTVTHHLHCFRQKLGPIVKNTEVEC